MLQIYIDVGIVLDISLFRQMIRALFWLHSEVKLLLCSYMSIALLQLILSHQEVRRKVEVNKIGRVGKIIQFQKEKTTCLRDESS